MEDPEHSGSQPNCIPAMFVKTEPQDSDMDFSGSLSFEPPLVTGDISSPASDFANMCPESLPCVVSNVRTLCETESDQLSTQLSSNYPLTKEEQMEEHDTYPVRLDQCITTVSSGDMPKSKTIKMEPQDNLLASNEIDSPLAAVKNTDVSSISISRYCSSQTEVMNNLQENVTSHEETASCIRISRVYSEAQTQSLNPDTNTLLPTSTETHENVQNCKPIKHTREIYDLLSTVGKNRTIFTSSVDVFAKKAQGASIKPLAKETIDTIVKCELAPRRAKIECEQRWKEQTEERVKKKLCSQRQAEEKVIRRAKKERWQKLVEKQKEKKKKVGNQERVTAETQAIHPPVNVKQSNQLTVVGGKVVIAPKEAKPVEIRSCLTKQRESSSLAGGRKLIIMKELNPSHSPPKKTPERSKQNISQATNKPITKRRPNTKLLCLYCQGCHGYFSSLEVLQDHWTRCKRKAMPKEMGNQVFYDMMYHCSL